MKAKEKAIELGKACLHCSLPRCNAGCPTGNLCASFVNEAFLGNLDAAAKVIYATNPFPELTSRLCDCSKQCQGSCVKAKTAMGPVHIQEIERLVASEYKRPYKKGEYNGKSVAIVGAGVAGLACAFFLLENGYEVHIYEKEMKLGGAIYTGIPSFRFNKVYLDDIEKDLHRLGAKIFFNKTLGRDVEIENLKRGYDKVVIAVGITKDNDPKLTPCDDVLGSTTLLRLFNIHDFGDEIGKRYKEAYVWGGGSVAMDCARSLRRVIKNVHVVYRRAAEQMPACKTEIEEAKNEGVIFDYLTNIKSISVNEDGSLRSIEFVKMELGEVDKSGRASSKPIAGSEYVVEKENMLIVPAIGGISGLTELGINASSNKVDDKIFVCGDCRYGAKTVAAAIKDGVSVAREIINE